MIGPVVVMRGEFILPPRLRASGQAWQSKSETKSLIDLVPSRV